MISTTTITTTTLPTRKPVLAVIQVNIKRLIESGFESVQSSTRSSLKTGDTPVTSKPKSDFEGAIQNKADTFLISTILSALLDWETDLSRFLELNLRRPTSITVGIKGYFYPNLVPEDTCPSQYHREL